MSKTAFTKVWKVCLGIATEIMMAVFIMACALGISWFIPYAATIAAKGLFPTQ